MKLLVIKNIAAYIGILSVVTLSTPSNAADLAAPFVGSWQVAKPAVEGVIVNVLAASCTSPVVILRGSKQGEKQSLIYDSPKAEPATMQLLFFINKTTWIPEDNGAVTLIAELKSVDKFWLYTARMGKADWDNPLEYRRCKAD